MACHTAWMGDMERLKETLRAMGAVPHEPSGECQFRGPRVTVGLGGQQAIVPVGVEVLCKEGDQEVWVDLCARLPGLRVNVFGGPE